MSIELLIIRELPHLDTTSPDVTHFPSEDTPVLKGQFVFKSLHKKGRHTYYNQNIQPLLPIFSSTAFHKLHRNNPASNARTVTHSGNFPILTCSRNRPGKEKECAWKGRESDLSRHCSTRGKARAGLSCHFGFFLSTNTSLLFSFINF